MRKILLFIIGIISMDASAKHPVDTLLDAYNGNRFYYISEPSNNKLILFLHGGLNNPYFKQAHDQISLNYLVEDNDRFIKKSSNHNFDVIIPITNDSMNWLKYPQETFMILKYYIKSIDKQYEEIYICGFSDGGTGSYKIFYNNPDYFEGLVVFNGYPQHSNFNKNVDYSSVDGQKVIFFSTLKDKNIPYEFLLTEYCYQKKENADTYFYLGKGRHSFRSYVEQDLNELFLILSNQVSNKETDPVQGFVKNDQLIAFYPFRKRIVRKYNFGKDIYEANREQQKTYKR